MINDGCWFGEVFGFGLLLEGVKGCVMVLVVLGFLGDVVVFLIRVVFFFMLWKFFLVLIRYVVGVIV